MKHRVRFINLALVLVLLFGMLGFSQKTVQAALPTDLFISEYIEGSSNNKAIEIYNGTGAAIDLATGAYTLYQYSNGSTTATKIADLTGTLAAGDVFVVAAASADALITAQADITVSIGLFNGDDAIELRKGSTPLDVFGQIGVDPGSGWGSGETSTADHTLRRKPTICAGDPVGSDAFDPTIQWEYSPKDTFTFLGAHTAICGAPITKTPKINEFLANITGTDDIEYIEVYGSPSTDYSAYTLLQIEGDYTGLLPGTIDMAVTVGTTDTNGLWLASLAANTLENGTITLLLVDSFTGVIATDLDTNDDGAFDSTPWTMVADSVAVSDGGASDLTYGLPVLTAAFDGGSFTVGGASRIPDGYDTDAASDWVRNDYDGAGLVGYTGSIGPDEAYNTPGALNAIYTPPPEACGDAYTIISAVQGATMASPLVGTEVAVEGIVVGDFQNNALPDNGDLNGFHVQSLAADVDADTGTSEGVFVRYTGSQDVSVGDHVRVRGSVSEYFDMTQITASQVWACGSGFSVTPASISLPVTNVMEFEPFEGMLVTFPQNLVISEYFNYDRYGEMVLTSQRHITPTTQFEPGPAAFAAAQEAYQLDSILVDDGRTTQNPDPAIHPNGAVFTMDNLFRGGSLVTGLTGVLDYSYSLYRIQPTQGASYSDANPREAAPTLVEGDLSVASFNVLNFFVTLDNGVDDICSPSGTMECRGADTVEEFNRQRDKIVAAMSTIAADVFGLMEIENNSPLGNGDAVAYLVDQLNAVLGAGTYAYIDTGAIGTDAIKQAILYKPATVTPLGAYQLLDSSVDPRFVDTANRPTLAQEFSDNLSGESFVVAVNHLKSKGSACAGDPDLIDGAGNCNLTRKAAAAAMVDWLGSSAFADVDKVLIIGDLNSYAMEDPIDMIKLGGDDLAGTADDYFDMIAEIQGPGAYGYVFDGRVGYLDYAIANKSMVRNIVDTNFWHINADEPDLIDYDMSFKLPAQAALYAPDVYRSSDHDPVIVTLRFGDVPLAVDDAYETDQDVPLVVDALNGLLVNDFAPGAYDQVLTDLDTAPMHGSLTLNLDGSFTYTPDAGFYGTDSFVYLMVAVPSNPALMSNYTSLATVTITVNPAVRLFLPIISN